MPYHKKTCPVCNKVLDPRGFNIHMRMHNNRPVTHQELKPVSNLDRYNNLLKELEKCREDLLEEKKAYTKTIVTIEQTINGAPTPR